LFCNLFVQALIAQLNDTPSLAKALANLESHKWQETLDVEYSYFLKNNTWQFTNLSQGRTLISCKWIFRKKYNVDGILTHHKAILMARGVFQHYDIDYEKTFSPVMKITSLRLLIALVATYDLEIH
jgi:hypothetical protein